MIIGVTGYGATGASACIDMLKEFEGVQGYRSSTEFQIIQQTDGILDLQYNLCEAKRRLNSNAAIKRFRANISNPRNHTINKLTNGEFIKLCYDYIESLTSVSWKGASSYDSIDIRCVIDRNAFHNLNRVIRKLLRALKINCFWPPLRERYFSFVDYEEFSEKTRTFINQILVASGFDLNAPIILEQAFNTTNPTQGMELFGDAKAIIVDRDPRDVYIITNYTLKHLCGFMPNTGNVQEFVRYYKAIHQSRVADPNVLYIQYEDLIFRYEYMINKFTEFTGLKHVEKGQRFKPQHSINNTQQYKKYPELESDILYIESELKEYLYAFEENRQNLSFEPVKLKAFDRQDEADKMEKRKSHKG